MELSFEGGILRPWAIDDASELCRIANNKKIADNLRDGFPYPYSYGDAVTWLDMVLQHEAPARFFAIISEEKLAGSIGMVTKSDIYRKNIEIGYFVAEDFWRKGIATKAIRAVTGYAFNTFNIIRIYAEPFSDNIGSRRALENAGYKLEATLKSNVIKNGMVKDSCIYSLLEKDFRH